MELLLVVATLAIVATVGMPYISEAYYSMHDGTAESMVTGLISSAKSRAIAGRTDECTISFKTDGTIEVGSNTYKLPSNFEITTAAEYTGQTQTFFFCSADYGLYFILDCFMLEMKIIKKEFKHDKSRSVL